MHFLNCGKPRAGKSARNKDDEAFSGDDTGSLSPAKCCGEEIVFS